MFVYNKRLIVRVNKSLQVNIVILLMVLRIVVNTSNGEHGPRIHQTK